MDAMAALDYLQGQGSVKRNRIAVIGWSYGGVAALTVAAYQNDRLLRSRPEDQRFRAAIAFYPRCSALSTVNIPTLLLLGSADESTPPAECVTRGQELRRNAKPIDWIVYPGAFHGFDHPHLGPSAVRAPWGETLRYDAAIVGRAQSEVRRFLKDHLL
jgi:dienelactone hydrolase